MPACTDTFGFNQTAMFAEIRESLPTDRTKSQNLIDSKDDMLFVWNSRECCLLALNWRMAKVKGFDVIKHQILPVPGVPSDVQFTTVSSLFRRPVARELIASWGHYAQISQEILQIFKFFSNLCKGSRGRAEWKEARKSSMSPIRRDGNDIFAAWVD
ncbi:unnamed protein product [Hermetia illucens]|uniref:Uncharacterized protein n=1 Tax=Hermetia illucens TaxID=343691 RepID=A0A7R8UUH3_HERIL|nr:unnamed protein product [Hermetia illucens]